MSELKQKTKSKTKALVLCFLFGGLGLHRFYLGYSLVGVIQLFTLGGIGIWSMIDFFLIISGGLKPNNGSYEE